VFKWRKGETISDKLMRFLKLSGLKESQPKALPWTPYKEVSSAPIP